MCHKHQKHRFLYSESVILTALFTSIDFTPDLFTLLNWVVFKLKKREFFTSIHAFFSLVKVNYDS